MATPQRQYPPEPEREPEPELTNLGRGGVERSVSSGWRFGFWWIWALVIVGIWYVGFGWGNSGGWIWGHHHAATAANDTALSGPGVAILNASSKQAYVGQGFAIRNVPVERQASQQALWIGSRFNSVPMLVVLPGGNNVLAAPEGANPPENASGAPGNTVVTPKGAQTPGAAGATQGGGAAATTMAGVTLDLTGQVKKAPPAAQAKQQWGLSDADANQLEQEGAYIEATQAQRSR